MMHRFLLPALLVLAAATPPGCDRHQPASAAPTPTATLLGTWEVIGIGDKRLAELDIDLRWYFTQGEVVVADATGREISRNHYAADATQVPHHLTILLHDVVDVERRGLYEIKGDKLRISWGGDGEPRPLELKDADAMVLKRLSSDPGSK